MKNRLNLDFSLNSTEERQKFINNYINSPQFQAYSPTSSELETMANYILWGKNSSSLNFVEEGLGEIETRNKTWSRSNTESLDALLESPTFNENILSVQVQTKKPHFKFDREKARQNAPPHILPQLESLFHQIDRTELGILFYELSHNRRKKEIRQSLLNRFSLEEQKQIQDATEQWTQLFYLNQKHFLVELFQQQYELKDGWSNLILSGSLPQPWSESTIGELDEEILVLPFGLKRELEFRPIQELNPFFFSEKELSSISNEIWFYKSLKPSGNQLWFDFRDEEHLYQLFQIWGDLDCAADEDESYKKNIRRLLDTAQYYFEFADLNQVYVDIFKMKLQKRNNYDIAFEVNHKYGKNYSTNYISTIFCKKIIPAIGEAAARHFEILGNLFFEEEFKKCSCCGTWLLKDEVSFMRKGRSPDGLNSRCKKCDKLIREKKNG